MATQDTVRRQIQLLHLHIFTWIQLDRPKLWADTDVHKVASFRASQKTHYMHITKLQTCCKSWYHTRSYLWNCSLQRLILLLQLALQPAVGFGLSNNIPPFFPICHQLSPSPHSYHLKIPFYLFFPSFPGSSPSSRPFKTNAHPNYTHTQIYGTHIHIHGRGSNPGESEIFRTRPDRLWGPPSLLYNAYRVSLSGVKRPGRDVNLPPHLAPRLKKD
jgi:hypothetical protein